MARKKKHPEHENLERWLVSYADFITLLFAFFTVLYALSQTDKKNYQKAVENIQRSFMSAGGIFPLKGAPFSPFNRPADRGSAVPPSPDDKGSFSKEEQTLKRMEEQIRAIYEQTTGLGLQNRDVEIVETETGFKIRLGEFLLYEPGSDKIRRANLPFLFELGKRLATLNLPVQVEGHTDANANTSADDSDNWKLSSSRAYNIVQFLIHGSKFPKELLSMAGFADTRPIDTNETEEGRARNRRVELSIIQKDKRQTPLRW